MFLSFDRETCQQQKMEKDLSEQLSDQDRIIINLERKHFLRNIVMGLQYLNIFYQLESQWIHLSKLINYECSCHIFIWRRYRNSSRRKVIKVWRHIVCELETEVRAMLDKKCGERETVEGLRFALWTENEN
jgi:hypothetical protein